MGKIPEQLYVQQQDLKQICSRTRHDELVFVHDEVIFTGSFYDSDDRRCIGGRLWGALWPGMATVPDQQMARFTTIIMTCKMTDLVNALITAILLFRPVLQSIAT